jgi:hypothetical protein
LISNAVGFLAKVKQARQVKLFSGGIAAALFVATFIGAGAAPVGPSFFTETLGLSDHGATVSQAVHDAMATLEEGEEVGPSVSEAACTAAHDRTTLPQGAQNAPGQLDREPKDCKHPSNAVIEAEPIDETEDVAEDEPVDETGEVATQSEHATHGQAVSQAVHDAKANLQEGEKVGPAVSEAACTAAHDRTTLPLGSQNAPGQQGREPKDCTHPSNKTAAGESEEEDSESEAETAGVSQKGKASAPGQQKKNGR